MKTTTRRLDLLGPQELRYTTPDGYAYAVAGVPYQEAAGWFEARWQKEGMGVD